MFAFEVNVQLLASVGPKDPQTVLFYFSYQKFLFLDGHLYISI